LPNRRSLSDAEIEAAYRRQDERLAREPLATKVRYLPSRDLVLIEMNNGHLSRYLGDYSKGWVVPLRQSCGTRGSPSKER
jgi:hypothetical protein